MRSALRSSTWKQLPLLMLLLLLATAANKRSTPVPPPPIGVTVTRAGGARVWRAVLPGTVSAVELPKVGGDRLALVVLLGSESRSLYRLDAEAAVVASTLRPQLKDVPEGKLGTLDLDGDGAEELLIAGDAALRSIGPAESPRAPVTLLDTTGSEVLLPSRWSQRSLQGIVVASVGRARLFAPRAGTLAVDVDVPLPTRAARPSHGIRLSSPRILPVDGDSARLAAAPQAVGKQRLRTLLLDATGSSEAWSLLPTPEDVDEARYATIDGGPALIVTTTNADKLGIFEGKKIRVFALGADRTQAGRAPILAAQTTSHRWLPVDATIADVDRDGHDDVIVVQRNGMGGGETVVETFLGRGDGAIATPGRRLKWELRGDETSYGADLTGDAIADLAVVDEEALSIFAGTSDPRRALVAREPIRVPIMLGSDGAGSIRSLRTADLDGDGTSEAILLGDAGGERGAVFVVSLEQPRATAEPR